MFQPEFVFIARLYKKVGFSCNLALVCNRMNVKPVSIYRSVGFIRPLLHSGEQANRLYSRLSKRFIDGTLRTNRSYNQNNKTRNMKKLLLTLTMLLCVSGAFGQTAQKLIAKYSALPNAEYKENTEGRNLWLDGERSACRIRS